MIPSLIIVAAGLLPEGWLLRERLDAALQAFGAAAGADCALSSLRVGPAVALDTHPDDIVPREMAHDRVLRSPLYRAPGLDALAATPDSVVCATRELQRAGLAAAVAERVRERGPCWLLQPAHVLFATDHLRLLDGATDTLQTSAARTLAQAAAPGFSERGFDLEVLSPAAWLLLPSGAQPQAGWALRCASRDAAAGKPLDAYLPEGDDARAFRRLMNETQMLWFADDVNQQREVAGLAPVNGFWISGALDAEALQQWQRAIDDGTIHFEDRLLPARLRDDPVEWLEQLPAVLDGLDTVLRAARTAGVQPRVMLCGDLNACELLPLPKAAGGAAGAAAAATAAATRAWLRRGWDRAMALRGSAPAGQSRAIQTHTAAPDGRLLDARSWVGE